MAVGWQTTIAIAIWISVLIQLTYATAKAAALSCDANVDRTAKAATKICIVSFQNDVISIYATAKAATVKNGIVIAYRTDFNLRYRECSDVKPGKTRFIWKEFQSTLTRRQRQQKCINTLTIFCI